MPKKYSMIEARLHYPGLSHMGSMTKDIIPKHIYQKSAQVTK